MGIFKSKKVDDPDGVLDFWPSFSLTPPSEAMLKSWEMAEANPPAKRKPAAAKSRKRA